MPRDLASLNPLSLRFYRFLRKMFSISLFRETVTVGFQTTNIFV